MHKDAKCIFFGTPAFAVPSLKALHEAGYAISAVVTTPDQPVGRKGILVPSPVKQAALELNFPVLEPDKLDDSFFKTFTNLRPDICIIVAYGKIIPAKYLVIPRYGFVNIHASLLPKYRGPSPIQAAIFNGEKETGISLQLIDAQIDHGPIIAQKTYELPSQQYYPEIARVLSKESAQFLVNTLPDYFSGNTKPQEQDHSQATFCHRLSREDGKIAWSRSAEEIFNQIRALSHEPGTWTTWQSKILRISKAEVAPIISSSEAPGAIVKSGSLIAVQTATHPLILLRVQLEGGKEMDITQFILGKHNFIGSTLE